MTDKELNEPFWRMMMSYGQEIPGHDIIPDEVANAVAWRISRYIECPVDPIEGKAIAAFVLLALKKKAPAVLAGE